MVQGAGRIRDTQCRNKYMEIDVSVTERNVEKFRAHCVAMVRVKKDTVQNRFFMVSQADVGKRRGQLGESEERRHREISRRGMRKRR